MSTTFPHVISWDKSLLLFLYNFLGIAGKYWNVKSPQDSLAKESYEKLRHRLDNLDFPRSRLKIYDHTLSYTDKKLGVHR